MFIDDNQRCGFDLKVSKKQYAFPRCTAIEIRWRRKAVERGSCVTVAIRRPISLTSSKPCLPQTPDILIASGTKSTPEMMSLYFNVSLTSAVATAEPASLLLATKWLEANVSGHVASQARHRPRRHGSCVTPSGRLPVLLLLILLFFNCPWYFIPKGEEINAKKL